MINKKLLRSTVTFAISTLISAGVLASASQINASASTPTTQANSNKPSPEAVKYAINGYEWALEHNQVTNPNILTIVDFNQPSFKKRLWVIDLKNDHVLMHTYVAQGRNTGAVYATRFSNSSGTHESSPGVFTTGDVYEGEHGHSLRVNGLEQGINSNALSRAIVIHPASYVTSAFVQQNGYAGRSYGCFAVSPRLAGKLIDLVKNGTVLFAYASVEKGDSRVNHALSSQGRALYDRVMGATKENVFERLF